MSKQHLSVIIPVVVSGFIASIVVMILPENMMENNIFVVAFYFFPFLAFGVSMGLYVGAKKTIEKIGGNKTRKIRTRILKRMRVIKRKEGKNENIGKQIVFGTV